METVHANATPEEKRYRNSLTAIVHRTQLRDIQKTLPLRVLSDEDFKHWQTNGFVVVRQAVPADKCEAPGRFPVGVPGDGPWQH